MQDFRKLKVWHLAHELTLETYKATSRFPAHEQYGLTAQMRRSAASIPTNLAEGCGRHGDAELIRFAQIAMGSASELEYQLLLSRDLNYLNDKKYEDLNARLIEVKKMLSSLISRLRASTSPNGKASTNPSHI